jgi:ribosomal protein S8
MKNKLTYLSIFLCLLIIAATGAANAYATTDSLTAAGKVYVSNVTYDPRIFFTDDVGTVTYEVANGDADQGVVVNHATFSDTNIRLISGSYDSSSNIGPGRQSSAGTIPTIRTYTFSVVADATEGTYYPTFSLSFRDAEGLFHRGMVQVDNTPLVVTILSKPDAFTQGRKKTITVQVANPRKNDVKNVILEVTGAGFDVTPSETFIGSLASGAKTTADIAVTPYQPTTLGLTVNYDNGDNPHKVTMELPIAFGEDKKQAEPIISNIQVKSTDGIYHITGDVTNAGLENANSVVVTSLLPAVPEDPYKSYVVGVLKPDDFGSFEVTFSADNGATIPVQLSYKDVDGNVITSRQDVKISSNAVSSQKSDLPLIPIIAGIIIVGAFVGGWFFYLRKKK